MQQTTNYQLPIYETNDVTSWLTVFNNAMQAIDTAIFNAKSEADQATASIATLSTTVGTHTTAIESLTSSLGTVATDLLTVTGTLNTITALIGNGEPTTTDKTIIGAINELHADIQGLTDPDASDVDYDNTTSGLTATDVQGAIDELETEIQAIPTTSSNVRWDETSDRFQVLKNGNWVDSIRAFVNSISVWVNGVFGISTDNGTHRSTSAGTATPFVISGNSLNSDQPTGYVSYTLTSDDEIVVDNYSALKIKFSNQTDVTLNISALTGNAYLFIYRDANAFGYGFSTTKDDFYTNKIIEDNFTIGAGTIGVVEVTIE